MREDIAEIDYSYPGGRLVCPCGVRRPEGFYQSDSQGNALKIHDRTCAILTCSDCGRVMTVDGAIIGRREVTHA